MSRFQISSAGYPSSSDLSHRNSRELVVLPNASADDTTSAFADKAVTLPAEQRELLDRLQSFELDKQDAELPFSLRLARDNMWNEDFAGRVCFEYRRFLFLAATTDQTVTPSEAVDEAWHLHLLYTKSYWNELCSKVLARPLHHVPTEGGDEQREYYMDSYRKTLTVYEEVFGTKPPTDIWPSANERFRQVRRRRTVNLNDHWIVRKPGAGAYLCAGIALMVLGWRDIGSDFHGLVPAAMFIVGLGTAAWPFITAFDVGWAAAWNTTSGGCGGCGCGG